MASAAIMTLSSTGSVGLQPAAIRYGIQELARRAGVSVQIFSTWYIDFHQPSHVDVYVDPGTHKRIRFPRLPVATWEEVQQGKFHTATANWINAGPPIAGIANDLKIPFALASEDLGPIFYKDTAGSFVCAADLPASALLTLSRFEETLPFAPDAHGRFPASASIACRDGFLDRPVVDELGIAFEEALNDLLPGRHPAKRELRVKLSHDVDEIGIPFSVRSAVAKALKHNRPDMMLRDLAAPLFKSDTAYQAQLRNMIRASQKNHVDAAVYWKASARGPYDTGYSLDDPRLRKLMTGFRELGVEMGLHPSYGTFDSPALLRAEVQKLKLALNTDKLGGRQDYLRWLPQSWAEWDALGISYDCSVGFADRVGFRAGTCLPYRPWIWSEQRQAKLLEIPLLAMDSTMRAYMRLSAENAFERLHHLVDYCSRVGGVFTLAWHNTTMMARDYAAIYHKLLQSIAGSLSYDWRAEPA